MVSCVITTYKRPVEVLKRAVDSVINQTYKDIQVIVVNDYPEDKNLVAELGEMLSQYSHKVEYIVHEKNSGACTARNTGLEAAVGEFIGFLDDDDVWEPKKIETLISYLAEPEVGLVYSSHTRINERTGEKRIIYPEIHEGNVFRDILVKNFVGSTSFPLLRTEIVRRAGGFDPLIKSSQDVDMWIRIAQISKFKFCSESVNTYFVSEVSISSNIKNKIIGYEQQLEKYHEYYNNDKDLYNHKLNMIAWTFLYSKEPKLALRYYIKALRVKPISKYNFLPFVKIWKKYIGNNIG